MKLQMIIIFVSTLFIQLFALQDDVIHINQVDRSLQQLWDYGLDKGDSIGTNFWIGYSIIRETGRNHSIHTGHSRSKYPSLSQMVYGREVLGPGDITYTGDSDSVKKELAILVLHDSEGMIQDVKISDMESGVKLKKSPLVWLGVHDDQMASLNLQKNIYNKNKITDVREDLIIVIALHQVQPQVKDFLIDIIENENKKDLREEAVFWLGQQDAPEVTEYLYELAQSDDEEEVREKAVFALSQLDNEQAVDYVIELAKNSDHYETRKEAIFWLGQIASARANETLEDIVYDENEQELKEQAIFALSQLPENEGVSPLIKIATEHENAQLRKKPIFWLGQTGDPRALETIISIIKEQ